MNILGSSNRTSIAGYLLAAFIAVQPILMEEINFNSRSDWFHYIVRLIGAALVAIMGRQSADSKEVKAVKADVKENKEKIEEHKEELEAVTKKVSSTLPSTTSQKARAAVPKKTKKKSVIKKPK